MSVNPNDFIKELFIQFKQPADTSKYETINKLYLTPIREQIKKSGTQDATLKQLAEELTPLKNKRISQLKPEDHEKIFKAFATSITSSGYSSFTELEDPLHLEAMSLEKIKENYIRLQQHLINTFVDPISFQKRVKEDYECDIQLSGNVFEFTRMPLDLLNQTLFFASTTIKKMVDQEVFDMPELFYNDNILRNFPNFSSQFQSSNKEFILDQSAARDFMETTRAFISDNVINLNEQDKNLFFNVVLLLKTQHILTSLTSISKYFFIQVLSELDLLPFFFVETPANINFQKYEKELGALKVSFDYTNEFVPKGLNTAETPLEDFHIACKEKGVANEVYLRASVEFIIRVQNQKISFEILSHKGSISFSVNPMKLISNSLGLSKLDLIKLQTEITEIKQPLENAFIKSNSMITSKEIQVSLEQSVQERIDLTDHIIEHALYEIPNAFKTAHIDSTALSETRFSIGGANFLQVQDLEGANTFIENANIFAARLSKDSLIQATLFNQILCLCSQRLPIALNFIKDTLTQRLAALEHSFTYTTDLKDASVKIGSVKGILGSKDDELLVSFDYHFDLSPMLRMKAVNITPQEIAQLEDCKRALDIDKVLSFSTRGSFILKVDKSFIGNKITLQIKDVKYQAQLD